MQVGILGSGDVGKALAQGFAGKGHDVVVGTRSPAKLEEWARAGKGKVRAASFADAARHGEVVLLAVNGAAAEAVLDLAGPANLAGKLVIDVTNPLDPSKADFGKGVPPALLFGGTDSLGERVQRKLPGAKVVKCFNTVNNQFMLKPEFGPGRPPMMIAGDDAGAKQRTEALLREFGWSGALDCGGITAARYLEAIVPLWVRIGMVRGRWDHILAPVHR